MASTNFTTHYEIPLPLGTDLTTPMDYNTAAEAVDTALFGAVTDAGNAATAAAEAVNTAEAAAGAAGDVAADLALEKAKITALQTRMTGVENGVEDVRSDTEDAICAYNEPTATSTHAYAIGDYFFYNDVLYMATAAIAIGDTITPDTNCSTTNITSELIQIKSVLTEEVIIRTFTKNWTHTGGNLTTESVDVYSNIPSVAGYTPVLAIFGYTGQLLMIPNEASTVPNHETQHCNCTLINLTTSSSLSGSLTVHMLYKKN